MKQYTPHDFANRAWSWNVDDPAAVPNDVTTAGALIDIACTLREIRLLLERLGVDGLHDVIRMHRANLNRARKNRLKKSARRTA